MKIKRLRWLEKSSSLNAGFAKLSATRPSRHPEEAEIILGNDLAPFPKYMTVSINGSDPVHMMRHGSAGKQIRIHGDGGSKLLGRICKTVLDAPFGEPITFPVDITLEGPDDDMVFDLTLKRSSSETISLVTGRKFVRYEDGKTPRKSTKMKPRSDERKKPTKAKTIIVPEHERTVEQENFIGYKLTPLLEAKGYPFFELKTHNDGHTIAHGVGQALQQRDYKGFPDGYKPCLVIPKEGLDSYNLEWMQKYCSVELYVESGGKITLA